MCLHGETRSTDNYLVRSLEQTFVIKVHEQRRLNLLPSKTILLGATWHLQVTAVWVLVRLKDSVRFRSSAADDTSAEAAFGFNKVEQADKVGKESNHTPLDNTDNMDNMDNSDNADNVDNLNNVDNADNVDNVDNADNLNNVDNVENADNLNNVDNVDNADSVDNVDNLNNADNVDNVDNSDNSDKTTEDGLQGETGVALCHSAVMAPLPCNYDAEEQLQATTALVNLATEPHLGTSGKYDTLMPPAMNVPISWVRGKVTTRVCIQALQLCAKVIKSVHRKNFKISLPHVSKHVEVLLAAARQAMIDGRDHDSASVLSIALDNLAHMLTNAMPGTWPALDNGQKTRLVTVMMNVVIEHTSEHCTTRNIASVHARAVTAATSILGATLSHYTPSKCEVFEVGGLVEVMARLLARLLALDRGLDVSWTAESAGFRQIRTAVLTSLAAHHGDIAAAFACMNELDKLKAAYNVELDELKAAYKVECMGECMSACRSACDDSWLKTAHAMSKIVDRCTSELAECKAELVECKAKLIGHEAVVRKVHTLLT